MNEEVAYIVTGGDTIKLVLNGSMHTATPEHPNYGKIKAGLDVMDANTLRDLVDIEKAVEDTLSAAVTGDNTARVEGGEVFFNDEPIHNTLSKRILSMIQEGFPVGPMLKFLENVMDNPSRTAVEELYDFLSAKGLPITEDGHFLAYKGITDDFKDIYTKKIDNSVGNVVEVPRNSVDDNRDHQCSNGLHVGHFDYASDYAGNQTVVLVKVNPRDAVSVPKDHNFAKLRTCRYEVVKVFQDDAELKQSLYGDDGENFTVDGVEVEVTESTDALEDLVAWYEENLDRDEAVQEAYDRSIYRTKEDARWAGKAEVCRKLAQYDLGE